MDRVSAVGPFRGRGRAKQCRHGLPLHSAGRSSASGARWLVGYGSRPCVNPHERFGRFSLGPRRHGHHMRDFEDGDTIAARGADAALVSGIGRRLASSDARPGTGALVVHHWRGCGMFQRAVAGLRMRVRRTVMRRAGTGGRRTQRVRGNHLTHLAESVARIRSAAVQHRRGGESLHRDRSHQQPGEDRAQSRHGSRFY